jgi:excisionase family DNA binding protein
VPLRVLLVQFVHGPYVSRADLVQTGGEHAARITDRLLTTDEVCAFLGIDRRTLERIYAKGEGPKRKKVGGTWRWRQSWLDAWIDEDERASA